MADQCSSCFDQNNAVSQSVGTVANDESLAKEPSYNDHLDAEGDTGSDVDAEGESDDGDQPDPPTDQHYAPARATKLSVSPLVPVEEIKTECSPVRFSKAPSKDLPWNIPWDRQEYHGEYPPGSGAFQLDTSHKDSSVATASLIDRDVVMSDDVPTGSVRDPVTIKVERSRT